MSDERETMKNCPQCSNAALWTDDDILWCPKCDYSAACAAQRKPKNQYTRKVNPVRKKAESL